MKKFSIVGRPANQPTSNQLKELFNRIANGRITKQKLQIFLRSEIFKNEQEVREILQDDIIFADEIAEERGILYTDAQLKHFADTMPRKDTVRFCKDMGYVVMPGPPKRINFSEIVSIKSLKTSAWSDSSVFSNNNKAMTKWFIIRKHFTTASVDKNWKEQQILLENKRVPNIAEVIWFIATFYEIRGICLFEQIYVRTSSVSQKGFHFCIGRFNGEKIFVENCSDFERSYFVGIADALKF